MWERAPEYLHFLGGITMNEIEVIPPSAMDVILALTPETRLDNVRDKTLPLDLFSRANGAHGAPVTKPGREFRGQSFGQVDAKVVKRLAAAQTMHHLEQRTVKSSNQPLHSTVSIHIGRVNTANDNATQTYSVIAQAAASRTQTARRHLATGGDDRVRALLAFVVGKEITR